MRKRLGVILSAAGLILLLNPQFDWEGFVLLLQKYLVSYWPVLLIILGMMLQVSKKPRKSHR